MMALLIYSFWFLFEIFLFIYMIYFFKIHSCLYKTSYHEYINDVYDKTYEIDELH